MRPFGVSSHLESLDRGQTTVEAVAAQCEVEAQTVVAALEGYRLARSESRRARRRVLVALNATAALAVVFTAAHALSQATCAAPSGWNPLLRVMCENQPAMAADVNANFQRMHDWLAQRTGSLDAGVTLTAPVINGATVTGSLSVSGLNATGPAAFGAVSIDGGLVVNDVLRAQAVQTTVVRSMPTSNLSLVSNNTYQSTGLTVTFTLDEPSTVDFRYMLFGSLSGAAAVAFTRLNLSPGGELGEARGVAVQMPLMHGSAVRQLAAGTYTATVDMFLSPGAAYSVDGTAQVRALTAHVIGISR